MSFYLMSGLPEEPDYALRAAMEPLEECEHEFVAGRCVDCEFLDADFDGAPHGAEMVTDPIDSPSYAGWAWGA